MKRMSTMAAAAALAGLGLAMAYSPAEAQGPSQVTITLRLTLNGTVPPTDTEFFATFGVIGVQFCLRGPLPPGQTTPPCVGGGRTYEEKVQLLRGATPVTFRFIRLSEVNGQLSHQVFSEQTIIPDANRTVSAFFTYGATSGVQAPATGSAPSSGVAAALVGAGMGLMLLGMRTRRRTLRSSTVNRPPAGSSWRIRR